MLNLELIEQAADRIAGRVHRTPVMTSRSFNEVAGCEVFFKCENLQRAGAFKRAAQRTKFFRLPTLKNSAASLPCRPAITRRRLPWRRAKQAPAPWCAFPTTRRK